MGSPEFFKKAVICLAIWTLCASSVFAQDSSILDLADEGATAPAGEQKAEKKDAYSIALHGYARTWGIVKKYDKFKYVSADAAKINTRAQLRVEGFLADWGHLLTASNFTFMFDCKNYEEDDFKKLTAYRVVETYLDLYAAEWLNFRIGRQFIIWGEIEGIECPTDIISPPDYDTETMEFEDSRLAPDAVTTNFIIAGKHKIQLIWIPSFTPANLPPEEIVRRGRTRNIVMDIPPQLDPPRLAFKNGEYAIRFSGQFGGAVTYGLGFLYGFDDLPDANIIYHKIINKQPANTRVYLVNHRVMIPTLDLGVNIKDEVTFKASGAFTKTEDFEAQVDRYKNSTAKYLVGFESANIFWDIYFSLYAGQLWVINYTPEHGNLFNNFPYQRIVTNELDSHDMLQGFDQLYRYKWLISNTIQRSFLPGNSLQLIITYFLSLSPSWKLSEMDYVVQTSLGYKFTGDLSMTGGLVMSNRMGSVRNYLILDLKYTF